MMLLLGVLQICFLLFGVCSLLYFGTILIYAGGSVNFSWIWIFFAAVCFALYFFLKMTMKYPGTRWKMAAVLSLTVFLAGILLILYIGGFVISGMREKKDQDAHTVIVLGAQVKKTIPSLSLKMRLDKAYEYALSHPDARLVLSGGKGSGEEITEAACMYSYLLEKGVQKERLLLEELSTSTTENLIFSNRLYDLADSRTGILSNDFHIYRALKLAKHAGYKDVFGIPASSVPLMQPHNIIREIFAVLFTWLRGGF